jgi:putative transposase
VPSGLKRFQESGQSHFLTFSCYHRRPFFTTNTSRQTFETGLERVRESFDLWVYGYVVMPEHVHLLIGEPERRTLADALKSLKQGVSRRLVGEAEHFWQKRYYDFNVRNREQFEEKLGYIHRNPVKRGLCACRRIGSRVVFVITLRGSKGGWRLNPSGPQEGANWQQSYPTQAKIRLEWGTQPCFAV